MRGRSAAGGALLAIALATSCEGADDVVAVDTGVTSVGGTAGTGGGLPLGGAGGADGPELLDLSGDLEAHDPTVLQNSGTYYLYHTGPLLPLKTSDDLLTWEASGPAFDEMPAWVGEILPEVTDLWSPDLSYFGGVFHLYYAASTFGTGVSCIGHATSIDLSTETVWDDQGPLICSDVEEVVDWDAIDPSAFSDDAGQRYLVFGSYSTGIKLIALNDDGTRAGSTIVDLAERPEEVAIQAPSALYRAPYFYLFSTFDRCCAGVSSTSNIRVGRSLDVEGPYLDREGNEMLLGGGSILLEGDDRFRGVGANSFFWVGSSLLHAYHAYDANAAGQATLRISEIDWDEADWPTSAGP